MVQRLATIRGGGGSVKVGTVGTIGSLMTRELVSPSSASQGASSTKCIQVPQFHLNGPLAQKKSDSQASSGATRSSSKHASVEAMGRPRNQDRHRTAALKQQTQSLTLEDKDNIILLDGVNKKGVDYSSKSKTPRRSSHAHFNSENTYLVKTSLREKPTRKGYGVVDKVDVSCGNPASSLSNRLKKLGISRMSQSFM